MFEKPNSPSNAPASPPGHTTLSSSSLLQRFGWQFIATLFGYMVERSRTGMTQLYDLGVIVVGFPKGINSSPLKTNRWIPKLMGLGKGAILLNMAVLGMLDF